MMEGKDMFVLETAASGLKGLSDRLSYRIYELYHSRKSYEIAKNYSCSLTISILNFGYKYMCYELVI